MHLREDVQLPVIAEMIEQVRVPSIAEWRWGTLHTDGDALAGVLPTLSTHFDADFSKKRQGSRCNYQVQECPTFDCLGDLCCGLRRGSAVFSVGVVVVLVTLTKLSVSGRKDACLKLLCSSIANFPAVFKKQRAGPRIHSRPPHPNTWIQCGGPRITWLARRLHTCRNCRG